MYDGIDPKKSDLPRQLSGTVRPHIVEKLWGFDLLRPTVCVEYKKINHVWADPSYTISYLPVLQAELNGLVF